MLAATATEIQAPFLKSDVAAESSGYTLIEVLVSIGLVTILLSMIIPAIQVARSRSRMMVCQGNLQEFGKAMAAHSVSDQRFPAGLTVRFKGSIFNLDVQAHSYMAYLLPYLDVNDALRSYDLDKNFCAEENTESIASPLANGVCPAAPSRNVAPEFSFVPSVAVNLPDYASPAAVKVVERLDEKYAKKFRGGILDYGAIAWIDKRTTELFGINADTAWGIGVEGMFPYPIGQDDRAVLSKITRAIVAGHSIELSDRKGFRDLKDGTSNTIMMIEAAGRPGHWEGGNRTTSGEPVAGGAWADFRNVMRIFGKGAEGKTLLQCDNKEGIYSFHSGSINTLFADGHVEAISPSIDGRVFISLVSIAGQDNIRSSE